MLYNTLIPFHWIEVDIETLLFSLPVKMPNFWRPKIDKKVINSSYQMSDFCENCNPYSSYHITTVGEYLVDIWFAEIYIFFFRLQALVTLVGTGTN